MRVLFRIFRFLRRNLSCLRLCGSPRRLPYPITFNPLLLFSEKFAVRGNNHVTPQKENVTFQISVTQVHELNEISNFTLYLFQINQHHQKGCSVAFIWMVLVMDPDFGIWRFMGVKNISLFSDLL